MGCTVWRGLWHMWLQTGAGTMVTELASVWKIDVSYFQQLCRARRGRVGSWNDVRLWKQANLAVSFFLSITSWQFVFLGGCGGLRGSMSSRNAVQLLSLFLFNHPSTVPYCCCPHSFTRISCKLFLTQILMPPPEAWATRLSLACRTLFCTVWPSAALYLPSVCLNEVGRRAGPRRSQQNGNHSALITPPLPIPKLQTGAKKLCCPSMDYLNDQKLIYGGYVTGIEAAILL